MRDVMHRYFCGELNLEKSGSLKAEGTMWQSVAVLTARPVGNEC